MILRVLLSFSLATIILGNPISNTKDVNYRLPTTYLPESYEVTLIVNSKTFKGEDDTFTGTVKIVIVKNTGEATTELKLHSSNSYITINSITVDDVVLESNRYTVDPVTDILTISEIDQEKLTLEISFTGKHADDMYGFYLSKYPGENDTTKYLVTTQFQGTYGRRAFPMFDEPEFKATFKISIRHPSGLTALSNTEGKTTRLNEQQEITEFEKTPKMSSYLVAFVVSEFSCEDSTVQTSVTHTVCSREEMKSWRGLALEDGPKILTKLNEYTGIDYKKSIGKMHQVAIPDFSAGAMENWGLATYRETALLWNEAESSNRYKQRVSTVISHEFAHMWFGNLVTTKWWSTTFLNEGFATLFEMFTTNEVHPDWELEKQFILEDQQAALEADSLITAQTLESDVASPEEVMGKFGTITYSKGGSILRMVQNFLGLENFKKGVQEYLQDRKYSTAEPSQLWTILGKSATEASKVPEVGLNEVMTNWVTKSGFPLVKVVSTDNGVQLTQERFLFGAKEDTPSRWYVPITYTQSTDEKKFESTLPQLWLTLDEAPVTIDTTQGSEWIILNNRASAFYRVNYDDALWEKISAALLKENFDGIDELNRAQIADDVFALAKTDYLKYSQVFKITEFLTNDVSYYPWYSAYAGFNFLLRRVGSSSDLGQSIQKLIVERMAKLVESVPFDKLDNADQIYTHKQVLALGWACRLGLESCKTPAVAAFKSYKDTGNRPNPNLRSIIYCNGLRYSENTEDWEFLWQKFQETSEATEQVTLISALGCTENKDLLNKYLENSLDANLVRPQDASSVYSAVYTSGSEVGVDVAFEFLVNNHQKIAESYKSMNALGNIVRGIAERFTTLEHIEKLKGLIPNLEEGTSFHSAASSAVSTAEANLAWVTNKIPELEDFFKELDPTSSSTADPTSSSTADPTSSSTADPTSSSTQDPTTPSTEDPTTEDLISSTTDKPVETSTKASSNIIKIPVFLILTLISINFLI